LKLFSQSKKMARTKILVVEDESIIARDIQDSLQHLGYAVSAVVASSEDAIQKAAETHPDLVLMDIHLRGAMDGVEAAKQITAHINIPVIYLTANADDSTFERAKVTEPLGYILKPFEERELCTTIEIALYKHQMERKLKEHDRWLDTILNSIGDGVIAIDAKGLVTFMNPVAEALTGWKQGEAIGLQAAAAFPIVDENNHTVVKSSVSTGIQDSDVTSLQNSILLTKTSAQIPIDRSIGWIKDNQGNIQGTVLVFRDITAQKRAEALKAFAAKLEQSNRELQDLLYVTSHILPSPVRKIQLFGDRLKENYGEAFSKQGRDDLERMLKAARRIKLLVNELQVFYRVTLKPLSFATVDLAKLAQEVVSDLAGRVEQVGGQVQVRELPTIDADPTQMRYLLQHLIDNALKFHSEGEAPIVKVQGRLLRDSEQQLTGVAPAFELCQILVEDNGIGFDEKYLERLFKIFQRLHSEGEYEGTGIGLGICHKVAERHGGVITAKSTPGQGATFIVTLPVRQPNVENAQ